VGFYIYQQEPGGDIKKKHYAQFGSITLNAREATYSQPKRELFGLMRVLEANRHWLLGCRKLIIETDAKYLKGMLTKPGTSPNATISRWIEHILMYHFTLRHVPGKVFGPDGLLQREVQPDNHVWESPDSMEGDPTGLEKIEYLYRDFKLPLEIEDFKEKI